MIPGIIASSGGKLPGFTDEFTGTNNDALNTRWSSIIGAHTIQSNKASTNSAPSTNPLSVFNANTPDVSLYAGYGELKQGWGVAFWVQDVSNWWAAVAERSSSFGCNPGDSLNGSTCTVAPFEYDCSYGATLNYTASTCGPDRTYVSGESCGGYDAGGLDCNRDSSYNLVSPPYCPNTNGCCGYRTYTGEATLCDGNYACFQQEAYCPGAPGGVHCNGDGNGAGSCYTNYYNCWTVSPSWLMYHAGTPYYTCPSGGTLSGTTCIKTCQGGGNTYAATTLYTHKLKVFKSVAGTVSEQYSIDTSAASSTVAGLGYIQVVTNNAGQITATAQMSTGGTVYQIQQTPSTPTRASRHGIIIRTAAEGLQASTVERFVYSPV